MSVCLFPFWDGASSSLFRWVFPFVFGCSSVTHEFGTRGKDRVSRNWFRVGGLALTADRGLFTQCTVIEWGMFRKNLPLSTLIELCSHFIMVCFRLKIELDSNIINPRNLFVIVSTWGKKKNACVHQQWNGYTSMVYLYMKYFKELTMNKVLLHTRSWMNFSDIILSKEFRHKRL